MQTCCRLCAVTKVYAINLTTFHIAPSSPAEWAFLRLFMRTILYNYCWGTRSYFPLALLGVGHTLGRTRALARCSRRVVCVCCAARALCAVHLDQLHLHAHIRNPTSRSTVDSTYTSHIPAISLRRVGRQRERDRGYSPTTGCMPGGHTRSSGAAAEPCAVRPAPSDPARADATRPPQTACWRRSPPSRSRGHCAAPAASDAAHSA